VVNLRSGEQKLPARLSTDADPHRLLLLQERYAASRSLTRRLTLAAGHPQKLSAFFWYFGLTCGQPYVLMACFPFANIYSAICIITDIMQD